MSTVLSQIENPPLVLHLRPAVEMTDRQFFAFCQINRDLRIERTAEGDIEIMTPAGGETSARNSQINLQLGQWAKKDRRGVVFDSSIGFILPNGATRSPDAAWVERSRLAALTQEQKEVFLPLCPDFVIELRSPSDSLSTLQLKMQEYVDNGAQLGWLIDPAHRRVSIYRQGTDVECLDNPARVSGAPILTGFVLLLEEIWEPGF
jgi:Uma2 family endonuclease